jgi:hypothetical protein
LCFGFVDDLVVTFADVVASTEPEYSVSSSTTLPGTTSGRGFEL